MEERGLNMDKEMKGNEYWSSVQKWRQPRGFLQRRKQRSRDCYKIGGYYVESQCLRSPTDLIVETEANSEVAVAAVGKGQPRGAVSPVAGVHLTWLGGFPWWWLCSGRYISTYNTVFSSSWPLDCCPAAGAGSAISPQLSHVQTCKWVFPVVSPDLWTHQEVTIRILASLVVCLHRGSSRSQLWHPSVSSETYGLCDTWLLTF